MKFWLLVYRAAALVFVILLIIVIISAFLPKIRQNQERQRQIAAREEENRQKEEAINKLRKQQDQFATDPKYVEKIAREELGKAKAGETIYRFGKPLETRGKSKTNDYLPRRK